MDKPSDSIDKCLLSPLEYITCERLLPNSFVKELTKVSSFTFKFPYKRQHISRCMTAKTVIQFPIF